VGLVGRNGSGKTTLFRLIRGELAPRAARSPAVARPHRRRGAGGAGSSASLLDTVLAADTERAALLAEAETATDPARIAADPDAAGRYRRLVGRGAGERDPQGAGL
jgi:ATP-binding cassette, subfamily F, member 3